MKSISLEEASEILHIERTRCLELAGSGELPGARIGRAWVFLESLVYDYLHQQILEQTQRRKAMKATQIQVREIIEAGMLPPDPALSNIQPNETRKGRRRKELPTIT